MVRLSTSDNVDFDVESEVIFQSGLIKDLVSDFGDHNDDMTIPLHNIRSEVLTKVIEFCERHRPDRAQLMKPYVAAPVPDKDSRQAMGAKRPAELTQASNPQTSTSGGGAGAVPLETEGERMNAVASGSGSGNTNVTDGTEETDSNGANETGSTGAVVAGLEGVFETTSDDVEDTDGTGWLADVPGAYTLTDVIYFNQNNKMPEPEEDGSKDEKEKEKEAVVAPSTEAEEGEVPAMVPMDSEEVVEADKEWNAKFIIVDHDMLFSLVLAANYLDIPALLELGCETVDGEIAGKTPAEVRELYGIPADYDVDNPPNDNAQGKQRTDSKTTKPKASRRGKKSIK